LICSYGLPDHGVLNRLPGLCFFATGKRFQGFAPPPARECRLPHVTALKALMALDYFELPNRSDREDSSLFTAL
jgi:hypothetical protein